MSRSGYTELDDTWAAYMWRGRVAFAIRGKRGQRLLREMIEALDAMREKALVSGVLVEPGTDNCCAMGAVLLKRGTPEPWNLEGDNGAIANAVGVPECLVQEIEYENDEGGWRKETPEQRWIRMRTWAARHLLAMESAHEGD